jgi:chemotaxis protein CheX
MIEDVEQLIGASVTEVFGTMLNFKVVPEAPNANVVNGEPHIASAVGFIGRLTGVVYLYCTCSFARRMTSGLLGIEESAIDSDEMVNDAMGELGNMIVGHLKSCLSDRGLPCVLTIPSIVRGSHFNIEPVSSVERRVFSYRCETSQLIVEVLIKSSGSDQK